MDNNKLAYAITKAIAFAENGGRPNVESPSAGQTGEMKSIYQYTPDTWKLYAKQILGDENAPMNPNTETYVTSEKVRKWVEQGYNAEQIASMWNAGEQRPDAYKQNWKGVNEKYGVSYDTPAYAKKVADYAKQFANDDFSGVEKLRGMVTGGQGGEQPTNQIADIVRANPAGVGALQLPKGLEMSGGAQPQEEKESPAKRLISNILGMMKGGKGNESPQSPSSPQSSTTLPHLAQMKGLTIQ